MTTGSPTVLILGAGINGCALARELALNGVSVWVVDCADIAAGATAGSSRLVHGGLRYLEYGEFDLVKESLAERARLVRLAPQFVRPLQLWIPVASRLGGAIGAIGRFFGWKYWPAPKAQRGVVLVRAGLAFYDAYAHDPHWPKYSIARTSQPGTMRVDAKKYRWLLSYFDAQVAFPECLSAALLEDARNISEVQGLDFRVLTYSKATLCGQTVQILPIAEELGTSATVDPAVIINATGAWVDETLEQLRVPSERLVGGTKGSHFFTFNRRLRDALQCQGIYAEASDGRPIFITPLDDAVLVGTTDVPFEGSPEKARASEAELHYLLNAVNAILPEVRLAWSDIDFHTSAVRPLPRVTAATTGAITRRHALVKNEAAEVPLYSIVGGKLTTMRSLAESTTATVLAELGRSTTVNSRNRHIPGGEDYPPDADALTERLREIAQRTGFSADSARAVWRLCGSQTEKYLTKTGDHELLPDTDLPCSYARAAIERQWASTLADLVERRLMLLYHQRLTRACLARLAELLVETGRLAAVEVDSAVTCEIERLVARYGKRIE
jgi:glycerol-3-phosphate dehydrogenase